MVEVKAYRQMALLSSAFAFRWSKWNMSCNSSRVVFRVQYANQETTLSSKEKTPGKCMEPSSPPLKGEIDIQNVVTF